MNAPKYKEGAFEVARKINNSYPKEAVEPVAFNLKPELFIEGLFDHQLTRREFLIRMELIRFSRIEQCGINAANEFELNTLFKPEFEGFRNVGRKLKGKK